MVARRNLSFGKKCSFGVVLEVAGQQPSGHLSGMVNDRNSLATKCTQAFADKLSLVGLHKVNTGLVRG